MSGADVRRLGERWQSGTRLFYTWKAAELAGETAESKRCMAQAEEWAAAALEDANPWPGLRARLEPLGKLKIEEQDLTRNWIKPGCEERNMALICFAVRLHRIQMALEKLETVPAEKKRGPKNKDMGKQIARARELFSDHDNPMSQWAAARQAVDELGVGDCAGDEAAAEYVRKRISDLPVGFS